MHGGRRPGPQAATPPHPHHDQGPQLNYQEHRPESQASEIHLSSSGALSRGGIGGVVGGGREGRREKGGEAEAEWARHFNRKTVTCQAAEGAPKKPQSGRGMRRKISQPGLLAQPDAEGSGFLNLKQQWGGWGRGHPPTHLIWEQIYGKVDQPGVPPDKFIWGLRTKLVDGQAGLKTLVQSGN